MEELIALLSLHNLDEKSEAMHASITLDPLMALICQSHLEMSASTLDRRASWVHNREQDRDENYSSEEEVFRTANSSPVLRTTCSKTSPPIPEEFYTSKIMQTRSFDEAEKMIEDELDEDFQSSSPVVERDVTRLQDDFKQFLDLSAHFKEDFDCLTRDAQLEGDRIISRAAAEAYSKGLKAEHASRLANQDFVSPEKNDSQLSIVGVADATSQNDTLQTLKTALSTIQSSLSDMESKIKDNIEAQCKNKTGTTTPPVMDEGSLPSFESKNKMTPVAILETVKIVAVVERGLEALVKTLEDGGGKGGQKGLMDVCEMRPAEVKLEMQGAAKGIRRVLKEVRGAHSESS